MKVTLDVNVLVRLATQDDAAPAARALHLLHHATLIAAPTPALRELVWVLVRGYRYAPAQVAQAVRTLIPVRHVVCHTPAVLALLEAGGDFADGAMAHEGAMLLMRGPFLVRPARTGRTIPRNAVPGDRRNS